MVEMPSALPPVAACEIQAARDYSVPLATLIARRQAVAEPLVRQGVQTAGKTLDWVYPVGTRWAKPLEVRFGVAPGALTSDRCWGARATAYILRVKQRPGADPMPVETIVPVTNIPTIRVQYLDRSYSKPLSF
ncbi:hypothetical protein [Pseudomonas reactans]|uniref:hypothetical protein n=1 Tax=Pseudomonas reactans TaxID=117680 RepID=UPI00159FB874|nr:hypothetical protein [Pseudomonas reactans]NWC90005.1 hypothetical protein [Pseudomonas reactans]